MVLVTVIDNEDGLGDLIDYLLSLPVQSKPSIYLDIEGVNLSRYGSISIIQIYTLPENHAFLLDVHVLGSKAFDTPGTSNRSETFRTILESSSIPKALFDVRNDNDALYNLYKVQMNCVQDIQVMEFACGPTGRLYVNGLSRCIERDLMLGFSEVWQLQRVKECGRQLFAPELGGSYEVFNQRPLSDAIRKYCVQDVQYLPALWTRYNSCMLSYYRDRVAPATEDRLKMAKNPNYDPKGREKASGPW